MSQNSHEYGQPLENWMFAMKYSRSRIMPYAGAGKRVSGSRRAPVLVDEPHLPRLRQIGGDDQQALRRHEGAYAAAEEPIGMVERAERARVPGINAQDSSRVGRYVGRAHASEDSIAYILFRSAKIAA